LPIRGYVAANNPKRSSTRRLSISLLVKTRTQMFAVNSWHQLDDESRKISTQKLRKIIPKITSLCVIWEIILRDFWGAILRGSRALPKR
jgi:hypothetical protein